MLQIYMLITFLISVNYLKQFTTNQIPSVSAYAVPFELEKEDVKEAAEQPQN